MLQIADIKNNDNVGFEPFAADSEFKCNTKTLS